MLAKWWSLPSSWLALLANWRALFLPCLHALAGPGSGRCGGEGGWGGGRVAHISCHQVVDDVAATWRTLDHSQSVAGHSRVGLDNAFDGSEDWKINREAALFWHDEELGIKAARQEWLQEVEEKVAAGLTWDNVRELIRHPGEDVGIGEQVREGDEFNGELSENELLWEEPADKESREARDLAEFRALLAAGDKPVLEIVASADDDPAELEQASAHLREHNILSAMVGSRAICECRRSCGTRKPAFGSCIKKLVTKAVPRNPIGCLHGRCGASTRLSASTSRRGGEKPR